MYKAFIKTIGVIFATYFTLAYPLIGNNYKSNIIILDKATLATIIDSATPIAIF